MKYQTILADPPWPLPVTGKFDKHPAARALPYPVMTIDEICALSVESIAGDDAHLWLWATNRFLWDAFLVMESWGFRYLNTVTWVKGSGIGAYFANTTEHLLMGYRGKCLFPAARYRPTHFLASRGRHSQKPEESYSLIESISPGPRLEMFSRSAREGWDAWGNEAVDAVQCFT